MPSGRPILSEDEILRIARWIDEGARPSAAPPLRRGDVNADGRRNLLDPVELLGILLRSRPAAACAAVNDVNADGDLNIADPLLLLVYIFGEGPAPPP